MKVPPLLNLFLAITLPLSLLSACKGKSKEEKITSKVNAENIDKGASKSKKKKMKKDGSKKGKKPKHVAAPLPPTAPAP